MERGKSQGRQKGDLEDWRHSDDHFSVADKCISLYSLSRWIMIREIEVLDKGLVIELNLFENISCAPVQLISYSDCALAANAMTFRFACSSFERNEFC